MRIVPCSRTLSVLAKNLLITVTASLLLGTASSAWAAAIGVSFVGRGADPGDLLAPTDVAGVYPQANWANVRDDGTTFKGKAPALKDDSGNLTDVALIFDASDSWNSDGASTTTPDQKLMKGILKANPTPDLTPTGNTDRILLVFSNLPPAGVYTVIVYSMENGADAKMDMTLGSTTYYIAQENDFDAVGDTYFPASPTAPGTYIDANYGGFTNVSPAANGTITITCKKFIDNPQVNDGIGVPGVQLIQQSGPAFPPNTTPVAITRQPFNRRAAVGSSTVAFDVVATGPVSSYYWYRNGSLIPGATGSSYAPLVGAGDNGAHYSVLVSNNVNSVLSADGVLTTGSTVLLAGAREQLWYGKLRADVTNGSLNSVTADRDYTIGAFVTPNEQGDNFADKLSAVFKAPVNGNYVFFINADDDADLFVSTDANPANKRLVAQELDWAGNGNWNGNDGGNTGTPGQIAMKRSDQWSPDGGATVPFAAGIPMTQGGTYYIEAAHHEGGGGDFVEATFKLVGDPNPANGTATKINQFNMAPYVNGLDGGSITITQQPASVATVQGLTATFRVGATSGYIGDNSGASPGLVFQWQSAPNGSSTFTDIAGATGSAYTTPPTALSDGGSKYRAHMLAGDADVTSAAATLSVVNDSTPPVLLGAGALSGASIVGVTFNEKLDPVSAGNPANYLINGVAATGATVLTNNPPGEFLVQLTVASPVTANFNLQVTGVKDQYGNAMGATPFGGTVMNLAAADIGSPAGANASGAPWGPDPNPAAIPQVVNVIGPGNVDVLANGNDYWNNADGFHFLYAPKTGSFDVRVRVQYVQNVDNWSAGAIEVREAPAGGNFANGAGWELSRHYFCKVDYGGPDATMDGTGTGANSYEFNGRLAPGDPTKRETANDAPGGSVGWGGTGPGNPSPVPFPNAWIRIARVQSGSSDHLLGYSGNDGVNWSLRQDVDLNDAAHAGFLDLGGNPAGPWPNTCYVGLGSTSHTGLGNGNDINPATGAPYQCWVQYRQYGDTPPGLSMVVNPDGTLTLTYTGTLYSATDVRGPYAPVAGASSPFTVNPVGGGPAKFFKSGR